MDLQPYQGWLALGLTPGLGARLAGKLLRQFRTPEAIFHASLTSLEACGLTAESAQAIHAQQPLQAAEQELRKDNSREELHCLELVAGERRDRNCAGEEGRGCATRGQSRRTPLNSATHAPTGGQCRRS